MKHITEFSLLDCMCDAHDQMVPASGGKLSGTAGKVLMEDMKKLKPNDKFKKALKFFLLFDGDEELWNMVSVMYEN